MAGRERTGESFRFEEASLGGVWAANRVRVSNDQGARRNCSNSQIGLCPFRVSVHGPGRMKEEGLAPSRDTKLRTAPLSAGFITHRHCLLNRSMYWSFNSGGSSSSRKPALHTSSATVFWSARMWFMVQSELTPFSFR